MAIAKMKKLILVTEKDNLDCLTRSLQELQSFEVAELDYDSQAPRRDENTTDFDQVIREKEALYDRVHAAVKFLQAYQPSLPLLEKLKAPIPELTFAELKEKNQAFSLESVLSHVESQKELLIKNESRQNDIAQYEDVLLQWQKLPVHPDTFVGYGYLDVSIGTLPQVESNEYINRLYEDENVFATEIFQTADEIGVLVTYPHAQKANIKRALNDYRFQVYRYPFKEAPKEALEKYRKELADLKKKNQETKKALADSEILSQLKLAEEYQSNELERLKAQRLVQTHDHLVVLTGWLEEDRLGTFKAKLLTDHSEDSYAIFEDEFDESSLDIPIVLKNSEIVRPYETLTEMYSLPKYNEIDPTPLMMPFYALFFGLMAADFGYGALLWLGTFVCLKQFNLPKGTRAGIKLFHSLSYFVMIWGAIFGSAFGISLPYPHIDMTENAIAVLILSVVLGVIQMIVALLTNAYLNHKQNEPLKAVADGLGWVGIIAGIAVWVIGSMVLHQPVVATVGTWLAILSAAIIVIVSILDHDNKLLGFGSGLYNLYNISGYVGDVVSYTRLMALAVSGGSIAAAFNMIINFLPGIWKWTIGVVLFVILHAINMFLSFLSAYVHDDRLQFVEFFGKFYEGGGRALKPLKALEKHIVMKEK